MPGSMSRDKGARAERAVVAWLREHGWPDARRYLAGDGRQPGDIDGVPGLVMEIKAGERVCLSEWLGQVDKEAMRGTVPLVVVSLRGEPDPGKWAAVMRLDVAMENLQ